jgi:hypothetical protein
MGFRLPYVTVSATGNLAPAVIDLNGPKYLIVSLDDYNQNHINNGLVTITELSKTLKIPNYYFYDSPYTVNNPVSNFSALENEFLADPDGTGQYDSGELLMEKLNTSYVCQAQVLPSAPRILTQSQIYTINQIIKNNDKTSTYRSSAPTTSDVFAILPVKSDIANGKTYMEFSTSLQANIRVYFGPVNIDRLRLRLFDDKGNLLNLNGADWTITILSEVLYQY